MTVYSRIPGMFGSAKAKFPLLQHNLKQYGHWKYLSRVQPEDVTMPWGLWHESMPLRVLQNLSTSLLIDLLQTELDKWIHPFGIKAIAVPHFLTSVSLRAIIHFVVVYEHCLI